MNDNEIPTIGLSEAATENMGKYGRMRKQYIQAHKPELYNSLLLSGTLHTHLLEIDQTARKRLELMMPEMAKVAGATQELKARDPLRWAGLMNTCKAQIEEVILNELIWD